MSEAPKEIWCKSGLFYDYLTDWSEGSWYPNNDSWYPKGDQGGVKYIRADLVKELKGQEL